MKISVSECKRAARASLSGNYGAAAGFFLCYSIVIIVSFAAAMAMKWILIPAYPGGWEYGTMPHFIIRFLVDYGSLTVGIVMMQLMLPGLVCLCLRFSRGEKAGIGHIWHGFQYGPGRFVVIGLVQSAVMAVLSLPSELVVYAYRDTMMPIAAFFIVWLMGMVVTIVQFCLMLTFFWVYWILVEDSGKGLLQGLQESYRLMRGLRGNFLYMIFSFSGWIILGGMSFGIGFLWLLPYIYSTYTQFYLKRKKQLDSLNL